MFTSVDLDNDLFARAWSASGIKTKKALIEEALKVYLRLQEQAGVRGLRGKLVWEGDLDKIRGERLADPR
jgi:Arc/MetJ family transcription regulator